METRFLETVLVVLETGSYAATARKLNLTPAAVTQRVRAIENELGLSLFARSGQKVAPTKECNVIHARLREILANIDNISDDLDDTGLASDLAIGAISTALSDIVPGILSRFAQFAPTAKLSFVPGTSYELFEQVRLGVLDAALLVRPEIPVPKGVYCHLLERQRFVLVTQASDTRSLGDILRDSYALLYDGSSWGGRIAMPWIREHVSERRIRCELDGLEAIVTAVSNGLGFAVLPEWKGLVGRKDVRKTLIPDLNLTRDIVLLHRLSKPAPIDLLMGTANV
jgi:DNA-binding transcriptional LysR family regulator